MGLLRQINYFSFLACCVKMWKRNLSDDVPLVVFNKKTTNQCPIHSYRKQLWLIRIQMNCEHDVMNELVMSTITSQIRPRISIPTWRSYKYRCRVFCILQMQFFAVTRTVYDWIFVYNNMRTVTHQSSIVLYIILTAVAKYFESCENTTCVITSRA